MVLIPFILLCDLVLECWVLMVIASDLDIQ